VSLVVSEIVSKYDVVGKPGGFSYFVAKNATINQ